MATAYHLLVDLWGIPEAQAYLLRYTAPALALMEAIRKEVDMAPLGKPFVAYAESEDKAWGPGVTILMPLQDSHMSLHCLEQERKAHFDLFSCKWFEAEVVLQRLRQAFWGRGQMGRLYAVFLNRSPGADKLVVEEIRW